MGMALVSVLVVVIARFAFGTIAERSGADEPTGAHIDQAGEPACAHEDDGDPAPAKPMPGVRPAGRTRTRTRRCSASTSSPHR